LTAEGGAIAAGLALGTLARWLMLRVDYRNYPGYPHGYVTHLSLGFIAAFLGSVAVPALVNEQYTAMSFLALAAQQFREIRNVVRNTLNHLEELQLVKRGADYVEGIARTFEARSYLTMFVAISTSAPWVLVHPLAGMIVGGAALALAYWFRRGRRVGEIAKVRPAPLRFVGANLYVEDIYLMNIGLEEARKKIMKWGLGLTLDPVDDSARGTLASVGQRQAILHDASLILGVRKDVATPEFTPLARRSDETGRIGLVIVPMEKDVESLVTAVERVPVLESEKGTALRAKAGRAAAD